MQKLTEQLSAKEQEIAELDAMLEEAQAESESHQTALRDCQDMLEELQTFSQGQEVRLQQLRQQLQVCSHHYAKCSAQMHKLDCKQLRATHVRWSNRVKARESCVLWE